MKALGLRCSPSEFSFSIIEGIQKNYELVESGRIKYPKGYHHCDLLKWFYLEIERLISTYEINAIGVKGTEPMSMKGKSYGERMELEGMIFLQAAEKGIKYAKRKVNGTIAKDLGLKGRAKYLVDFDYSTIPNFFQMSIHFQEATQVAISMLH